MFFFVVLCISSVKYCFSFYQAKILYRDIPFGEDERENIKLLIQTNVYGYLCIILEGRERFEDESLNDMRKDKPFEICGNEGRALACSLLLLLFLFCLSMIAAVVEQIVALHLFSFIGLNS